MQPPRVNRYVDNILIKTPAFYGDTGGPGWYPELQHPVQTRLAARFNPILRRTVYINPNAIFMTGVRHGMTLDDVRRVFDHLGVGHGMVFTLFKSHKFIPDISIIIAEFPCAEQAEEALFLANQNRHLLDTPSFELQARYSDVNATGPLQGTVRDILLVREELSLTRLYLPTTVDSSIVPPPPTPAQWNAVGFSRDAFRGKRKSEDEAPTPLFDMYQDPTESWRAAEGRGGLDSGGYDLSRAPRAKRRQLESLSIEPWHTRSDGGGARGDVQSKTHAQGKGYAPLGLSEVNGVKVGVKNRYTESGGVQAPTRKHKGKAWNKGAVRQWEVSTETVGPLPILGVATTPASTTHNTSFPITLASVIKAHSTITPFSTAHGETASSPEARERTATPSQRALEMLVQLLQTIRDPSELHGDAMLPRVPIRSSHFPQPFQQYTKSSSSAITPSRPAGWQTPLHEPTYPVHSINSLSPKHKLDEPPSPTVRPLYSALEPYRHHFLPSNSHPHLEPRYIVLSDEHQVLTIAASRTDLNGNPGEVWAVEDLTEEQRELLGLKKMWVFTGVSAEKKWRKVGGKGLLKLELEQE